MMDYKVLKSIHHDKITSLNRKGAELLSKIESPPARDTGIIESIRGKMSLVTRQMTKIYQKGWIDISSAKRKRAIFFVHNGQELGWFYGNYDCFAKLRDEFLELVDLKGKISSEAMSDILFDWLQLKYLDRADLALCEYADNELFNKIEDVEIWIPVSSLDIDNVLQIGEIKFRKLNDDVINSWYDNDLMKSKNSTFVTSHYKNKILPFKDYVFATYNFTGDRIKAFEIAIEKSKSILAIMHLFSSIVKNPTRVSHTFIVGQENLQYVKHLIVKDNILITPNEQALSYPNSWKIRNDDLSNYIESGLDRLLNIMSTDTRTEYENYLINALLIYVRICFIEEIEFKLILIFSALESIFINKGEDIHRNLSEKIALFVGNNLDERKHILENMQYIYDLRSAFMHKATVNNIEDLGVERLKYFFQNVWGLFMKLIRNERNFITKKQLLEFINDLKMS